MKTSKKGISLIKHFESLELDPYKCSADKWTIGYGHVIRANEQGLKAGITEEIAEELLKRDLLSAESDVELLVTQPMRQHEFDALVSFVFNLGRGNFAKSTLLKKINGRAPMFEIEEQINRWVWAGGKKLSGLVRRRKAEAHLYRRNQLKYNFEEENGLQS